MCEIHDPNQSSFPAIVWPASEKIQDNIIQTTKAFQTLYGLKLGDQVLLSRTSKTILDAHDVVASECQDTGNHSLLPSLQPPETDHWAWLLRCSLKQAEVLCPGMIFPRVCVPGEERTFQISTINSTRDIALYRSENLMSVSIAAEKDRALQSSMNGDKRQFGIDTTLVGGLDSQLLRLNSAIDIYSTFSGKDKVHHSHRPRRGGILLHGPSGTGKSMLLRMVAQANWRGVFYIHDTVDDGRTAEAAVQKVFSDAHRLQPSVIIIDNIGVIAGKKYLINNTRSFSIANSLCQAFDRLFGQCGDSHVLVLAATRDLASVDESLRSPSCFHKEIEIPAPGTDARAEILHIAVRLPKNDNDQQLLQLANRTHGYVGADLVTLLQETMDKAASRIRALDVYDGQNQTSDGTPPSFSETVTEEDIEAALLETKPTAMKEIFLDTPKVRWSQVGGQGEVKQALQEAVIWPLKYRADFEANGLLPKKGLLLYGPPGCSKTLAAKAIATEANVNFIAVKGPELLSMYVGESERAIREIFRKARAASPSVIFFDEIDTIGAARERSKQELHTVSTLLNELDGIEALKGVFVLAATNCPEILDPALLRAGRLGDAIYVGLPDYETRLAILAIATREMKIGVDVDLSSLARTTDGYSGADIVTICEEAKYAALREKIPCGQQLVISTTHFEQAVGKVAKKFASVLRLVAQYHLDLVLGHDHEVIRGLCMFRTAQGEMVSPVAERGRAVTPEVSLEVVAILKALMAQSSMSPSFYRDENFLVRPRPREEADPPLIVLMVVDLLIHIAVTHLLEVTAALLLDDTDLLRPRGVHRPPDVMDIDLAHEIVISILTAHALIRGRDPGRFHRDHAVDHPHVEAVDTEIGKRRRAQVGEDGEGV
ncbi:MAG: hypothetical protein Q9170_007250 [Blastenia crenularia]